MKTLRRNIYLKLVKPTFDFCCAIAILIAFGWLYCVVALLVRIKLGSPVLFKQQRPGKNGKIFHIYKFRTMTNATDANGELLPREERLVPFGMKLRSTSLDELPEIFNVLRGEMSLVGPRPLRVEYLPLYSKEQARRHDVLPGITGWAQVCGRNNITWERKFELDVEYVERVSFFLDVKILFMTLYKALIREGADNIATNEGVFRGNQRKNQQAPVDYVWFDEQSLFTQHELLKFIEENDKAFEPPLVDRGINLSEYVDRLVRSAAIRCAVQDGRIVGVNAFYCNDFDSRKAFITWLAVSPDARSQHIGTQLVADALERSRQVGMKTCEAQASNKGALKIYCERFGGEVVGRKQESSVEKTLIRMRLER